LPVSPSSLRHYGALFAAGDLVERRWLYQLAATLREVHTWSVDAPAARLTPDHPLNHLPLFTQGTGHLERVLAYVHPAPHRPGSL
jgi:hypothetical protein